MLISCSPVFRECINRKTTNDDDDFKPVFLDRDERMRVVKSISELLWYPRKKLVFLCLGCWTPNEEKKTQKEKTHAAKTKRAFKAALFVGEYGIRRRRWGVGRDARSSTVWVFFVSSPSLCLLRSFGLSQVKEREVGFEKIGKKQRTFLVEIRTTSAR